MGYQFPIPMVWDDLVMVQAAVRRIRNLYQYSSGSRQLGVLEYNELRVAMTRFVPKRRLPTVGAGMILILIAIGLGQLSGPATKVVRSEPAPLFYLAGSGESAAQNATLAAVIAEAPRVNSISEVEARSGAYSAILMIDDVAAARFEAGSLQQLTSRGYAVIGLNVPLDRLVELTSFDNEVGSMNAQFKKNLDTTPADFRGPFFSLVWRSRPDAPTAYWGQMQQDLTSTLFSAVIADYRLRVRGLIAKPDGTIVPLSEYSANPGSAD